MPAKSKSSNVKSSSPLGGKVSLKSPQQILIAAVLVVVVAVVGVKVFGLSHAGTAQPIAYTYSIPTSSGPVSSGFNTVTPTGTITQVAGPSTTETWSTPAYSPDHTYLAWTSWTYSQNVGQLNIKNLNTGQTQTFSAPAYEVASDLTWYPNDSKLAFIGQTSTTSTTYALYTVNVDGTGLAAVPYLSSLTNVTGPAVTGNDSYVVFSSDQGVYAVTPGSQPIAITGTGCNDVASRPGTAQDISYTCFSSGKKGSETYSVIYNTIGAKRGTKTLFSSTSTSTVGNVSYWPLAQAWSWDGATLALELQKDTVNSGQCAVTQQFEVTTLAYGSKNGPIILTSDQPVNHTGCYGGGSFNQIAWSFDDTAVAYLDQGLSVVSAAGGTPTVLDKNADGLSW